MRLQAANDALSAEVAGEELLTLSVADSTSDREHVYS
jgi:hypothetical protein